MKYYYICADCEFTTSSFDEFLKHREEKHGDNVIHCRHYNLVYIFGKHAAKMNKRTLESCP